MKRTWNGWSVSGKKVKRPPDQRRRKLHRRSTLLSRTAGPKADAAATRAEASHVFDRYDEVRDFAAGRLTQSGFVIATKPSSAATASYFEMPGS